MWEPMRPVPPATAILRCMMCLLIVASEGMTRGGAEV